MKKSLPIDQNDIYSVIKKMIESHFLDLQVAKSSSKEYIRFLKESKESPILLIKNHIETQWGKRMERIEKLLKNHESICYLVYKSAAIAVTLRENDSFRAYILSVLKEGYIHKYLLDAFRWFRRMYSYVQLIVQRTGICSQRYSDLFPKSWQEMLREDRELVITLEESNQLQSEIEESVHKTLKALKDHIDGFADHHFTKNVEERKEFNRIPATNIRITKNPLSTTQFSTNNSQSTFSQEIQNGKHQQNEIEGPYHSLPSSGFGEVSGSVVSGASRAPEEISGGDFNHDASQIILSQHPPDHNIRYQNRPPSHVFDFMPTSYYFMHDRYDPQQVNAFDLARHEDFAKFKTPYIKWLVPDRALTGSEYRYNNHITHIEDRDKKESYRARPHSPSEDYHIKKHFSTQSSNVPSPNKTILKKKKSFAIPKRIQPVWI